MLLAPKAGAEAVLARLLADFFRWATAHLPEASTNYSALSVETAQIEEQHFRNGAPLMLTVPCTVADNAARCLRRDVWEGRILPEFNRAQRLAARLTGHPKSGKGSVMQAKAIRSLFAPRNEHDSCEQEDRVRQGQEASKPARFSPPHDVEEPSLEHGSCQASQTYRERKRRRVMPAPVGAAGPEVEALAHHLKPQGASNHTTGEARVVAKDSCRKTVNRWLGLRALLHPTDNIE
jgi:hypothetical protein